MLQEAGPGREAALIRTAYASGSRVGELAGLTWEDVQARDGGQAQITMATVLSSKPCLPGVGWRAGRRGHTPSVCRCP